MIEMNSLNKRQRNILDLPHPLIAFFASTLALVLFFIVTDTAPFGRSAFLMSDLAAQYAPKLVAYKDHLFSEGMLSYSFQNGMGKNVWGVFGYYLSSPFNFITFLFPSKWIAQSIVIMIILKLSLAGAFMSYYLETRSNKKDKSSILFALLYVFSTYSIIYMMNIMWLDGFLILPLLLVVVEKYIKDRSKWIHLVICLTILFISGYYIAYMVGIFSFIYLLGRCVEKNAFSVARRKSTIKMIIIFVGSAVLATGLSTWLLLPAGLDSLAHPDHTILSFSHTTTFQPLQIVDQFFVGAFDNLMMNKPFLYAGMIANILVLLFFLHPQIPKRRKIVAGIALLFFFLSFLYTGLVRFWHLFDDPNWFFHRQSFLAVFVWVSIAYNAFIRRNELERKHIIKTGIIILSVLLFLSSFGEIREEGERFFINTIFIVLLLVLLWESILKTWPSSLKNIKKYVLLLLVVVVLVEIIFINALWVRAESGLSNLPEYEKFSSEYHQMQLLRDYADKHRVNSHNNFYRMEMDRRMTIMSNLTGSHYLNYPSVSVFQSVSNKKVNRFLKQLGMQTNFNYFYSIHGHHSMPLDSFLGIEYLMTNENYSAGYPIIMSIENEKEGYYLFHNEQAFPLFFPVQSTAVDFDYYRLERNEIDKNYFSFQNDFLASLFSEFGEADIYYPAQIEGPKLNNAIVSESMNIEEVFRRANTDGLGMEPQDGPRGIETHYLRVNSNASMVFEYEIRAKSSDPLYFCIPTWGNDLRGLFYLNGERLGGPALGHFSEIIELGRFEPGETIIVRFETAENIDKIGIIDAYAYHCDINTFSSIIDEIQVSKAARNIDVKNGHVQAELYLENEALVLTTIPYEKGWTLYVNGEIYDIIPYQETFISILLNEGAYDIELIFRAPGLSVGIAVSIVSMIVFIAFISFSFIFRGKNDRKTKKNS